MSGPELPQAFRDEKVTRSLPLNRIFHSSKHAGRFDSLFPSIQKPANNEPLHVPFPTLPDY